MASSVNNNLQTKEQSQRVSEQIMQLFKELVSALPPDSALISLRSEPGCVVLELSPTRRNAAQIAVTVPDNAATGVTLIAGRGSFFEIPLDGHRYTNLTFLDEIGALCDATIAGNLEESVLLDRGEVLQGTGTIKLAQASKPTTVRWRQIYFRPFRKKERKQFRYEPYFPGSLKQR
jgi:hypothetical protein